ncbi:UNVERIFIED_CONTAM: hypothetical protein NCL1_60266 [Trichonephila clavipes]
MVTNMFIESPNYSPKLPTWSPKRMPNWFYCQDFAKFSFKRHYNICELHFADDAIRKYTESYDEKTGEKICVPLKRQIKIDQLGKYKFSVKVRNAIANKILHELALIEMKSSHNFPTAFDFIVVGNFKGNNNLGMAYNREQAATSTYFFVIQSLLFKEVVHLTSVKKIKEEKLFAVVKNTIVELDSIEQRFPNFFVS